MIEVLTEAKLGLSFRERIEGGVPVVCPLCGKLDKMEPMGSRGWGCPWCSAKVLTQEDGKRRSYYS